MSEQTSAVKTRTRQQLLNLLKQQGAMDSAQLSAQLGVGAMAVRQHLYELQEQGLVTYTIAEGEAAKAVGRPAKHWHLTPAAEPFFPTGYAELTVTLLQAMRQAFGEPGLDKLLEIRMNQQIAGYQARLATRETLQQKLQALAQARSEEGYMATVIQEQDDSIIFVENHCPICDAAKCCLQLCTRELETFQRVLGDDVAVERCEHILAGARRCAYSVRAKQS